MHEHEDARPDRWGLCASCGEDCCEADYNPTTRESLCVSCRDREPPEPDYDSAACVAARKDPTHPVNVEIAKVRA